MLFVEAAKHMVMCQDHMLLNRIAKRTPGPLVRLARRILSRASLALIPVKMC